MVGMLIRRENGRAVFTFVVAVVGLDERIVGQLALAAVVEKLLIGSEELRLMLQQVHHFER